MKRSESVLVYGVSTVLALILVVAVAFGDPGAAATSDASRTDRSERSGAERLQELVADPGSDAFVDAHDPAEASDGADSPADGTVAEAEGAAADADGPDAAAVDDAAVDDDGRGTWAMRRAARDPALVLGPSTVESLPDGSRFRVVRVRPGDTFSQIVERWTGSLANSADVAALNEDLDLALLKPGMEIWVPWIDDAILVEAHEARQGLGRGTAGAPPETTGRSATAPVEDAPPPSAPAEATREAVERHVLGRGETLWQLAEARVGPRLAPAYVERIAEINGLDDPARVRHGQTILLPPRP